MIVAEADHRNVVDLVPKADRVRKVVLKVDNARNVRVGIRIEISRPRRRMATVAPLLAEAMSAVEGRSNNSAADHAQVDDNKAGWITDSLDVMSDV
jgi:hypothetical protein